MEHGETLRRTVRRLGRMVRHRRGVFYGLRGLTWGLGLAMLPVLLRSVLGPVALPLAAVLASGGAIVGLVYGLLLRVPTGQAARLADRAFALHDRLATGLELVGDGAAADLAAAAVRDAAAHTVGLDLRRAVPWRWPRDVRVLPVAALALLVLPYLPPLPLPGELMPALSSRSESERQESRAEAPQVADRPAAKRSERVQRVPLPEREYAQRPPSQEEQVKGDLAAIFKDTTVAQKRPDFSSFLKHGDDRLRVLERVDSLPDLQRDFTRSPYKMVFQKARRLLSGLDPRELSRERLRRLLDEMNRIGRPGGGAEGFEDWGQDVWDGVEALEGGQMSRALEAMERALDKLRAMEGRQRARKALEGGRLRSQLGEEGGWGGDEEEFEQDLGGFEGSLPGKGTNPAWRGDPTARFAHDPLDLGIEGQLRRGRREAYGTNLIGRGAQNPSRLPYMSVLAQYRKMMEDSLVKENIPFDYRTQVKEYFRSLEAR